MLLRPPVVVVAHLFAALGLASVGRADTLQPLFTTVLVVLAGWFVNAAALNDLADEEIDRVNLPTARGRPLISGHAGRRELWVVALVSGAVAFGVATVIGWMLAAVVAAGLAINVAYSFRPLRLSQRGVLASLVLSTAFVVVPYLIGVFSVTADVSRADLAILPGLYLAFTGRILLKDFRDAAGDALFGKWTFLLRHGRATTCWVAAVCWAVGVAAIVAALPGPAVGAVAGVAVACLLCALHGLARLAAESDAINEQVIIGAIAMAGRGLCIAVLAQLIMVHERWPLGSEVAVLAGIGTLFVVAYLAMSAARGRVTAIRPY
jgi:4-hydroxybenzoate polyprenyltransferase